MFLEKLIYLTTDTLPLLFNKQTSDTPKAWLLSKGAVFVGYILGSLPRRAKTNNGDNDTSVAKARPAEYPGVVRFQ